MKQHRAAFKINLTGTPALVVAAALLFLLAWRLLVTDTSVDPALEERIRDLLAAEYSRLLLPELKTVVEQNDAACVEMQTNKLKTYQDAIAFTTLKSRGSKSNVVVRAEITVDNQPPPAGKKVRYFQFHKYPFSDYIYDQETFALDYYFPFLN